MVDYEYVMSGCAHTRFTLLDTARDDIKIPLSNIFREVQGRAGHSYTALFNAYTESRIGKHLYNTNIVGEPLHADSGGLQVITRGSEVTPEIMEEVYKIQAAYSGVAMCFDEIPLRLIGESKIGDTTNRLYDRSMAEDCVQATCKNIINQIKAFELAKSDSKVMLIAHGNKMDDYVKWIERSKEIIPSSLHDRISGISLAGTSSGAGDRPDIERIFSFYKADAPSNWKENLHLLGVGSISRMLPVAAMVQSGLLSDMKISYDSTTHSSNLTRGRYVDKKNKVLKTPRGQKVPHYLVLECVQEKFPEYQIDPEEYCWIMSNNRDAFIDKYGDDALYLYHTSMLYTCMSAVINFTTALEKISKNRKDFLKLVKKKNFYMSYLLDVKSETDYIHFMNSVSPVISKEGVKVTGEQNSLEEFF